MKLMESGKSSSKSKNPRAVWPQFVVCVDNSGYEVSLELGKVYRRLKPHLRDFEGWVRVVDESGEDYLFPAKRFVPVDAPKGSKKALTRATSYSQAR